MNIKQIIFKKINSSKQFSYISELDGYYILLDKQKSHDVLSYIKINNESNKFLFNLKKNVTDKIENCNTTLNCKRILFKDNRYYFFILNNKNYMFNYNNKRFYEMPFYIHYIKSLENNLVEITTMQDGKSVDKIYKIYDFINFKYDCFIERTEYNRNFKIINSDFDTWDNPYIISEEYINEEPTDNILFYDKNFKLNFKLNNDSILDSNNKIIYKKQKGFYITYLQHFKNTYGFRMKCKNISDYEKIDLYKDSPEYIRLFTTNGKKTTVIIEIDLNTGISKEIKLPFRNFDLAYYTKSIYSNKSDKVIDFDTKKKIDNANSLRNREVIYCGRIKRAGIDSSLSTDEILGQIYLMKNNNKVIVFGKELILNNFEYKLLNKLHLKKEIIELFFDLKTFKFVLLTNSNRIHIFDFKFNFLGLINTDTFKNLKENKYSEHFGNYIYTKEEIELKREKLKLSI